MSVGAEVISSEAPVIQAAQKMRRLDVGSLPVCAGDRLTGLLTDRDIAIRLVAAGLDPETTPVSEIMTPDVIYCFEDQTLEEAAALMEAHQIRRLPIVNRAKRLVGMLALSDFAISTQGIEDDHFADEALEPSRNLPRPGVHRDS